MRGTLAGGACSRRKGSAGRSGHRRLHTAQRLPPPLPVTRSPPCAAYTQARTGSPPRRVRTAKSRVVTLVLPPLRPPRQPFSPLLETNNPDRRSFSPAH
eukprot:333092-Pleurochrysis_carterae.AAC.1